MSGQAGEELLIGDAIELEEFVPVPWGFLGVGSNLAEPPPEGFMGISSNTQEPPPEGFIGPGSLTAPSP